MLALRDETFGGTFPFAPRYRDVNGFRMHYVDEGAGEPLVMVHGDPTWGYLYRRLIAGLSPRWRCVVPDHMGMGKSDVPGEPFPYRLHHHVANLEALVLGLDLSDITLIVHDWGGPVGLGFAARHPHRIRRLILTNTWAFAPWPGGPLPRLLEIIRSERGERFVLERNGYVEVALRGTTAHPERLEGAALQAYLAPYPTPASRLALLCWSRDIPLEASDPSFADMRAVEDGLARFARTPALIVWGMQDPVLSAPVLERWRRVWPHARVRTITDASHFVQEDAPEEVLSAIEAFLDEPSHPTQGRWR